MESFNIESFEGLILVIEALRDLLIPFAAVFTAFSVFYLLVKEGMQIFYDDKQKLNFEKLWLVFKKACITTSLSVALFYFFPQILEFEFYVFDRLTKTVKNLDLNSIFADSAKSSAIANHLLKEGYLTEENKQSFLDASIAKKQIIIFKYKVDRSNSKRAEENTSTSYSGGYGGAGSYTGGSLKRDRQKEANIERTDSILKTTEEPNVLDMVTTYPITMLLYYGLSYLLGMLLAFVVIFIEGIYLVLFNLFAFFGLIAFLFGIFPFFQDRFISFIKTFGALLLWPIVVFGIEFFSQFVSYSSNMNIEGDINMSMSMLISPFVTLILYSSYGTFLYMIIGSEGGAGMVGSAVTMASRLIPYAGSMATYMSKVGTQSPMAMKMGGMLFGNKAGFGGTSVGKGMKSLSDAFRPPSSKSASEQTLEQIQDLKSGMNI